MTKSFIAELRSKPDKRDELIRLQVELKMLVGQEEPDVLVYEFLQSDDDPDLFQVVASFRDDAAFEKHMHIGFHDRLVPPILECLDGEMKLAFYRSLS